MRIHRIINDFDSHCFLIHLTHDEAVAITEALHTVDIGFQKYPERFMDILDEALEKDLGDGKQ